MHERTFACSRIWVAHGARTADRAVLHRRDGLNVPPASLLEDCHRVVSRWLSGLFRRAIRVPPVSGGWLRVHELEYHKRGTD